MEKKLQHSENIDYITSLLKERKKLQNLEKIKCMITKNILLNVLDTN
jgi:hypothetical protein